MTTASVERVPAAAMGEVIVNVTPYDAGLRRERASVDGSLTQRSRFQNKRPSPELAFAGFPRLDKAAGPHPGPGRPCGLLLKRVAAFGVFRPVKRITARHEP